MQPAPKPPERILRRTCAFEAVERGNSHLQDSNFSVAINIGSDLNDIVHLPRLKRRLVWIKTPTHEYRGRRLGDDREVVCDVGPYNDEVLATQKT